MGENDMILFELVDSPVFWEGTAKVTCRVKPHGTYLVFSTDKKQDRIRTGSNHTVLF
jgi:hypothetical protein